MLSQSTTPSSSSRVSIIIPAHNEESTIGRTLLTLLDGVTPGLFETVVVCNGCTDGTASVVRAFGHDVSTVEIPEPSKQLALKAGDLAATVYPRLYLDADVAISGKHVGLLVDALQAEGVEAAGPSRVIPREGVSLFVRWYYDVWEQLPQVKTGLFGRGVIAFSERGHARIAALPAVMADDLVISEAFDSASRTVVEDAQVVIWPPRTVGDLVRRRIRVATGVAQADQNDLRNRDAATSLSTVLRLARSQPSLAPRILVFLAVAVLSRIGARRAVRAGDFGTWLRDESSRTS